MRLPRWKREQKKRKEKKRLRLVKVALFLMGLILFLGLVYQVWSSLRKSLWDGRSPLTLVLNSNPVLLVSFHPSEQTLNVLSVPNNTQIETVHGYGFYQIQSVGKLGQIEGYGPEFLAESCQEFFGLPVENWISLSEGNPDFIGQESEVKDFILSLISDSLKKRKKTGLSRWDLFRLWWGIRGVRFDKVTLVGLDEIGAIEKEILPDGSQVLKPDLGRLDRLTTKLFSEPEIKEEGLTVGVYNATQHSGLAKRAARLINNLGGQVVEAGDWQEEPLLARCLVLVSQKDLNRYTPQRLAKIFGCSCQENQTGEERSEILLLLGEAYWQFLMEK